MHGELEQRNRSAETSRRWKQLILLPLLFLEFIFRHFLPKKRVSSPKAA